MDQVESSGLAKALARMSAVLLSQESVTTTVQLVTTLAYKTIPGTTGAGVSLMDHHGKRTTAATDPLVRQADLLQYELDEGPCLTAWRDRVAVFIDDVETERRWPAWTEAVMALGVRSVLSTPMVAGGTAIGAVKVYSYQRHAYDQDSQELLALFARQAAILLENAQSYQDAHQLTAQLKAAMTSRDLIGQAKGILIAQGAPDEQAAFAMLVTASQRTNTKVREVAQQLITDTASGQRLGRDRPRPSS